MASVLETFYFLFASNADDVQKGSDAAKKSSDELEDSLKDTEARTQKVGTQFVSLTNNVIRAVAGLVAYQALQSSIANSIAFSEELRMTGMAINENVSEIDAWGRATRQFGGDSQTLQATLKTLNNNIREAAFTGESSMSPALRRLGLNLRTLTGEIKTPLQLLPEIAKAFENISAPQAMHLGQQLGLDEATILLLKRGKAGVDELLAAQRALGVVTAKDTEASRKFKLQLAETSNTLLAVRQRMVTALLPSLTVFYEKLEDVINWVSKNDELVEGFFLAVAGAITAVYVPAMIRAAIATTAATWPILAVIAIVAVLAAGFAILYDEIVNFANGQDSLLGEAVKRWPILGKIIESLVEQFKMFAATVGWVSSFVSDALGAVLSTLDTIGISLEGAENRFRIFANVVRAIFAGLKSLVLHPFSPGEFVKAVLASQDGAEANPQQTAEESLGVAKGAIAAASSTPIAAQSTSSIVNNGARNKDVSLSISEMTIVTQATDAQGISNTIGSSLQEQIQQMIYNFDDGVRG